MSTLSSTSHSSSSGTAASPLARLTHLVSSIIAVMSRTPDTLISVFARLGIAILFWQSAQTKIISTPLFSVFGREVGVPATFPPTIQDVTYFLFEQEYALPLIPHELAAWMATAAELVLPILLLIGLATRFSALALLIMTAVIQFLVYPNLWNDHILWAAALLYLVARGGGALSLDRLIAKKFGS